MALLEDKSGAHKTAKNRGCYSHLKFDRRKNVAVLSKR